MKPSVLKNGLTEQDAIEYLAKNTSSWEEEEKSRMIVLGAEGSPEEVRGYIAKMTRADHQDMLLRIAERITSPEEDLSQEKMNALLTKFRESCSNYEDALTQALRGSEHALEALFQEVSLDGTSLKDSLKTEIHKLTDAQKDQLANYIDSAPTPASGISATNTRKGARFGNKTALSKTTDTTQKSNIHRTVETNEKTKDDPLTLLRSAKTELAKIVGELNRFGLRIDENGDISKSASSNFQNTYDALNESDRQTLSAKLGKIDKLKETIKQTSSQIDQVKKRIDQSAQKSNTDRENKAAETVEANSAITPPQTGLPEEGFKNLLGNLDEWNLGTTSSGSLYYRQDFAPTYQRLNESQKEDLLTGVKKRNKTPSQHSQQPSTRDTYDGLR